MQTVSVIEDVRTFATRTGNQRYVARDAHGNEYTTFREAIGERARELRGKNARISYHETQRGQYTNVYLDDIEPVDGADTSDIDTDAREAAWRTAVDAAPWLIGEPNERVTADELYEKLKPFEARVAADIKRDTRGADGNDE